MSVLAGNWQRLLVEPRRPAAIRNSPSSYRLVVGAVCVGAFMGQLDASIVTQAFPTFQRDLHASLGGVQWIGLAYLLILVSLVTAVGRIADMVGRKLLYSYGFAVFTVGSALCGLANGLPELIGFRAVQAVGAAMLQANSVAIIAAAMPRRELGRGIGLQGTAQALGLALGPAVGGLLVTLGGWRWIFFVNVPVGLIGVLLGLLLIPRSRHLAERRPFDWSGLAFLLPSVAALLLAVSYGNEREWTSAPILSALVLALVAAFLFVLREKSARPPLLDLSLFSTRSFTTGISSSLLSYVILFATLFVVPYLLESTLGMSVGRAGLELVSLPVGLGLAAPVAGRLADRFGARPLTVVGMVLTSAMLGVLAIEHGSTVSLLVELALVGVGLGLFNPANNAATIASVALEESGVASGVINVARGLGTSLGLALAGLMLGLFAGPNPHAPGPVDAAFRVDTLALAGVALWAAMLTGLRRPARVGEVGPGAPC